MKCNTIQQYQSQNHFCFLLFVSTPRVRDTAKCTRRVNQSVIIFLFSYYIFCSSIFPSTVFCVCLFFEILLDAPSKTLSLPVACLPRTTSLCLRDQYLVYAPLNTTPLCNAKFQSVGRNITDEQSRNHNDGRTTARQRNGYVLNSTLRQQCDYFDTLSSILHIIHTYISIFIIQTVTAQS